ncbi:hypothetical protein BBOR36S_02262 [Brevibacillus borstelensis]
MTVQHPDYEHEQKRLDETRSIIQKEVDTLRKEVKEITDDYVKQVVNYKKGKELRYLEDQGLEKPYFGRVDFLKDETYELDSVYIGKRGIVRSDTFDSIVVDWRAPIASLYYSGESKDAYFRSGREIVRGEVRLKRNFAIEDGKITGIYDGALKETIHREVGHPDEFLQEGYIDEFLAANLNQTNDSRLKDIVATIQSEQNDIIRADKDRPVVVQGVAGSGKTTIALHRLSYLIYNYQDSMMSKRFMVFAPTGCSLRTFQRFFPNWEWMTFSRRHSWIGLPSWSSPSFQKAGGFWTRTSPFSCSLNKDRAMPSVGRCCIVFGSRARSRSGMYSSNICCL